MARYAPAKRARELKRKAKQEAKAQRKLQRREQAATGSEDDDIDWSQAVGMPVLEGAAAGGAGDDGESEGEENPSADR